MEDKTSKPGFNKSGGAEKPKNHRNYTNEEMIRIIDQYAAATKDKEQKKDMLDIKDNYVEKRVRKVAAIPKRDQVYKAGIAAGLHPRETLENLYKEDREEDQRNRNRAVDKAKAYYHQNYSLTKIHKEAKTRTRPKEKDMTKE